ncbi:uro-adherence factor A-like [Acropora muricata]|uniref:uro-adherence factor A-like n=1 Tax=Acropora muricata TaxID=159855 RepID=UPI0034E3EE1A
MRRERVPADGHCLLHSWLRVVQAEGQRSGHTVQNLLQDISKEIEMNIVHYGAFLTGPWRRQLEAYKTEGEYNSDIVDVVIFALSNLSARACQLYTVSSGNVKKVHAITPWHPESEAMAKKRPHICLLFKGRHYDALISVNTAQQGENVPYKNPTLNQPPAQRQPEAMVQQWERVPYKNSRGNQPHQAKPEAPVQQWKRVPYKNSRGNQPHQAKPEAPVQQWKRVPYKNSRGNQPHQAKQEAPVQQWKRVPYKNSRGNQPHQATPEAPARRWEKVTPQEKTRENQRHEVPARRWEKVAPYEKTCDNPAAKARRWEKVAPYESSNNKCHSKPEATVRRWEKVLPCENTRENQHRHPNPEAKARRWEMVPCENSSNNSKPTTRKSDDQKDTNVGNKVRLSWSNLSSSVNGVSCDQKPQAIVADIANSHPNTPPTKMDVKSELSSIETPLKTETCSFDKENEQSEDTKESQTFNYTVGLKGSDISSNDECSPPDMKVETVVAEIADSVEQISETKINVKSELSSVETTLKTETCTSEKENEHSEDTKESQNLNYTVGLKGSDISSNDECSPLDMKAETVVTEIADSVEEVSETKINVKSELSSVETTLKTETCTSEKENEHSEDTKESQNLNYTVGLKGSDISSNDECSPLDMKAETVVTEIADSVEEVSETKINVKSELSSVETTLKTETCTSEKENEHSEDTKDSQNLNYTVGLKGSDISSNDECSPLDMKAETVVTEIADSVEEISETKINVKSELSSVETTLKTETCTSEKENEHSEDTKESQNLNYTVGLKGSDISSNDECSPLDMKAETVVTEIADSVEEVSETKINVKSELSSVETTLKTETCTSEKENEHSEDTKESQNLNYTVGLKESDISSNDECSPLDMKAETMVAEIADSVEEVSETKINVKSELSSVETTLKTETCTSEKENEHSEDTKESQNLNYTVGLKGSDISSNDECSPLDMKAETVVTEIADSVEEVSETKINVKSELSSVETTLKTETCTSEKENEHSEDTKESQNLNYTVGLKGSDISSNDECSPLDMKAETVVTEIADSVEEVSETKINVKSELSSVETTLKTETCTSEKENEHSEDTKESQNLNYTVGLKGSDISSNDECSPPDMKDEPVAEIADSVEEISQEKVVAISDIQLESTIESVNESDLKENLENPCVKETEEDREAKSGADDQAHSDEESEQTLKETESTVTIQDFIKNHENGEALTSEHERSKSPVTDGLLQPVKEADSSVYIKNISESRQLEGEMNFKVQVAYAPNTIEGQCDADSQDSVVENIGDSASDKVSEKKSKGLLKRMKKRLRKAVKFCFPCCYSKTEN